MSRKEMSHDEYVAAYGAFRAEFEAWHFENQVDAPAYTERNSVPEDVAPAKQAVQESMDRRG